METFRKYAELVNACHPQSASLAISKISDGLLQEITSAVLNGQIVVSKLLSLDDLKTDHLYLLVDSHNDQIEEKLDSNLSVLALHHFDSSHPLLQAIHEEVRQLFSVDVGSPFVIVNSRMWISHPNGEIQGPNAFHRDGFQEGHLKVMIYISPLSIESGYFEFEENARITKIIDFPAGTAIMFKNSEISHRGVPGTMTPRVCIEIALMRATADCDQKWTGHFYGRHLVEPTIFHHANNDSSLSAGISRSNIVSVNSGRKVNIGSGIRDWPGWLCFDELEHPNVVKISFNNRVILPIDDESVSLFYSSHCVEHLDDETVEQVFKEILRTAKAGAVFVLKIPDYDYFIRQFKAGISTSMKGKGIESVLGTWKNRINDNFINRLSMMFCGYWNQSYGDHFSGNYQASPSAYHGPAIMDMESLRSIFELESPREIAAALRMRAREDPEFARFNHQNAWSRSEMVTFLQIHGFEILSTQSPFIVQRFRSEIPDIESMQSWSAYYLARKL